MTFGLTYLVIGIVVAIGVRRGIAETPTQPKTQMAPDTFPQHQMAPDPMPKVNLTKKTDHHVDLTKKTDQYVETARKIQASEDVPIADLNDLLNDGSEF